MSCFDLISPAILGREPSGTWGGDFDTWGWHVDEKLAVGGANLIDNSLVNGEVVTQISGATAAAEAMKEAWAEAREVRTF